MSTPFSHFFEKINQISPLESNFTEVLETIALKPKMLYFYGKMPENMSKMGENTALMQTAKTAKSAVSGPQPAETAAPGRAERPKTVAIVGARHNTQYGQEVAYRLAYELGRRGVIVVSGLAYGIDSIAHRGCLDAGGVTLAVLGTPIDRIYPTRHLSLAAEILEKNGAVLSEYPPSCQGGKVHLSRPTGDLELTSFRQIDPERFPLAPGESISATGVRQMEHKAAFLYRNRLISGLADVVVVVEAASHSGSLNTAAHALEQGKEVFAVPGNITSPYSQGCNRLIAQGATPYTAPDDILQLLFPAEYSKNHHKLLKAHLIGDTIEETAVLKALAKGLRSGEAIMKAAILPPEVFNQTITMLEIKSRVRPLGANNWALR